MVCEKCGERMRVQNTRMNGEKREREYKCPKCGNKLYTVEGKN